MSDKPLPFSNGLQLKSMGAVLLLVLGVLIWRLTDATTTTARVLYIAAIVFELLFFVGLIFASRFIKAQHDKAEAAYRAQVAAAQADAAQAESPQVESPQVESAPNDDSDAAPGSGRPDAQ